MIITYFGLTLWAIFVIGIILGLSYFLYRNFKNSVFFEYKYLIDILSIVKGRKNINYDLPIIEVFIYGKAYHFLVDSGCSLCILDKRAIKRHNIKINIEKSDHIIQGLNSESNTDSTYLNITFTGGDTLEQQFLVTDGIEGLIHTISEETNFNIIGILGASFFYAHRWVIDLYNNTIWVRK